MVSIPRLVLTLAFIVIVATPHASARGQRGQFSLAVVQGVTVGQYTLIFRGVTGGLPAYDLYFGAVLVARFPLSAAPPNPAEYSYGDGNIGIATRGLAPDGTTVSGTLTVR